MKTTKDGGAAFPNEQGHCPDGTWNQTFDPGMSLRDWFAGMALQGLLAHYGKCSDAPKLALEYADAMIAERSKP